MKLETGLDVVKAIETGIIVPSEVRLPRCEYLEVLLNASRYGGKR